DTPSALSDPKFRRLLAASASGLSRLRARSRLGRLGFLRGPLGEFAQAERQRDFVSTRSLVQNSAVQDLRAIVTNSRESIAHTLLGAALWFLNPTLGSRALHSRYVADRIARWHERLQVFFDVVRLTQATEEPGHVRSELPPVDGASEPVIVDPSDFVEIDVLSALDDDSQRRRRVIDRFDAHPGENPGVV